MHNSLLNVKFYAKYATATIILLLLFSIEPFKRAVDYNVFIYTNKIFLKNDILAQVVAHSLSTYVDFAHDIIVILIFAAQYMLYKKSLIRTLSQIISVIIVIVTVFHINNIYLPYRAHHPSPSILYKDDAIQIKDRIEEPLKSKMQKKCFDEYSTPSAHGSTVIILILTAFHFLGPRHGTIVALQMLIWILPRIIVGRHGLSDIIPASITIPTVMTMLYISILRIDQLIEKLLTRSYRALSIPKSQ